jgi:hypothetical protein
MDSARVTSRAEPKALWIIGALVCALEITSRLTDKGRAPTFGEAVEPVLFTLWFTLFVVRPLARLRGEKPTHLTQLWSPRGIVLFCAAPVGAFVWPIAMMIRSPRTHVDAELATLMTVLLGVTIALPIALLLRLRWELAHPKERDAPAEWRAHSTLDDWNTPQGRVTMAVLAAAICWLLVERVQATLRLSAGQQWWGWLNVAAWCAFAVLAVVGGMMRRRRWLSEGGATSGRQEAKPWT